MRNSKVLSILLAAAVTCSSISGLFPVTAAAAVKDSGGTSSPQALSAQAVLSGTAANDDLLVKYDFNENDGTSAHDSSGHGLNATLQGSTTTLTGVEGKNFGGLSLSGASDSLVKIPNDLFKDPTVTDITVSLNINLTAAATGGFVVSLGSGGSTSRLVGIKLSGNTITGHYYNSYNGGTNRTVSATAASLLNTWTNVTFVVSPTAGTIKLYLDGVLKGTTTGAIAPISALYDSTKTFGGYIGESYWTGDANINGRVDDFRVYNSALSDEQIEEIAAMKPDDEVTESVVSTAPGVAPALPAYVYVPSSDGTDQELGVAWEKVDPAKYESSGDFEVAGQTTSTPPLEATAHVYVLPKPVLTSSEKSTDSIALNWEEQPDADEYVVYRSDTSGKDYEEIYRGGDTSFVDKGLSLGTTYYYIMNYSTGQGATSVDSEELAVKTDTVLVDPPADLAPSQYKQPYRVELNWSAVPLADTYKIYRADRAEGPYALVVNTADTVYKDTGVKQGSTYYYEISCVNDAGEGPLSEAVAAQTASDSVPPTEATVTGVTDSTASISWLPMPGATAYHVYRTTVPGKAYNPVYSGTATRYTDLNLITGVTYYYVVTYTSDLGTSVYSNEVEANTTAVPVPAPSALKLTGSYPNAVAFSWNFVVGANSFNVYRSDSADGTYTRIASLTDNKYKDAGLDQSTTYYYKISSVNGAGESAPCSVLKATTASMDDTVYNNETIKYDTDGNELPSGGEGFLQVGDTYYMYTGVSTETSASNSIGVYSSKDLVHWKFENTVFSSDTVDADGNHPPELTNGFKDERVKVVYDDKLKKYVMVFHYENAEDYSLGEITVSMSDTPTGDFTYVKTYHPDDMESRDMTLFKDVDGQVYLISAANRAPDGANSKITLFKFASDYKSAKQLYNIYGGPDFNGKYAGREAPCMVRKDGIYYLFTSICAGWFPSQAMYSTAKADTLADTVSAVVNSEQYKSGADASAVWKGNHGIDTWDGGGVGYLIGNATTFNSQSTYILPVTGTHGTSYILMSDRLKCPVSMGGTVWFPLQIDDGKMSMEYSATININTKTGEVSNIFPGTLISEDKPATASIEGTDDRGEHPAKLANDGDYSTCWWTPSSSYPAWWQVDLGQEYDIGQVQLSWYLVGGSEGQVRYKIWVSDDGVDYTLALDHSSNQPFYGFTCDSLSGVTARFVKVELTSCSVGWYNPEIDEAKIFGSPAASSADVSTPDSSGSYSYQIPDYITNYPATSYYEINLGNVTVNMPVSVLLKHLGDGPLTVSNDVTSAAALSAVNAATASGSTLAGAFDLNLNSSNGANIHELGAPATVTYKLTSNMIAKLSGQGTPTLFYYDPSAKKLIDMNAAFDLANQTVTFTTTHFSTYVIELAKTGGAPEVDKSSLQTLYDNNKSRTKGNYTDASWSTFQTALQNALLILNKTDATQDEVDAAKAALNQAVTGLKQKTSSGGGNSGSHSSSGSGTGVVPPTTTFTSDTTSDLSVNGTSQIKITSTNGQAPAFVCGTAGVFETLLVKTEGNDYYYQLTAIGAPGAKSGIYVNGVKLLVATVASAAPDVKCDTTLPFKVKAGASYTFKLTADAKPSFVAGTSSVFKVEFVKAAGKDYFYKVTAVGKAGSASGFYINSQKAPVTVVTVA